jgi:mRNA-degrading endonuclease toxin of MazEF toxin-antitoxin module
VPKLEQGRILWATMPNSSGTDPKRRTALVLTPTDEIRSGEPFVVVAITCTFPDPLPEDHVLLPWHSTGNVVTGLKRKAVAVCTWLAKIRESDVDSYAGLVPPKTLLEIVRRSPLGNQP